MKHTRNLMNSLITCTIALALVSTVAAQTATDSSVKVIRVKGPARYSTGNNVWQPLGPGTVIRPGTVIQTSTEKGSYVDLEAGRITGSVKKMSAASKFEIKLPNGVAGIRGTVFDISAEGVVRVFVGSMVVAWVDSKSGNVVTQVVMGGQQYDARSNQISPISEPDMQMFEHLVASMRVSTAVAPTNLALDR